jgi:anti-sigma factor RsiW
MTCAELRECLSAELDGEATAEQRETARQHLETCHACRQARAADEALRRCLAEAAWTAADESARDDAVIAALLAEGVCRPTGTPAHLWLRMRTVWQTFGASLMPSMRPALTALAASFLLTWGVLHWAETGAVQLPFVSEGASAATPTHPLDSGLLDRWLAGSPTLEALSRLQRAPAPDPPHARPRRGAVRQEQRHVG